MYIRQSSGFTLVEMAIVLAIIGLLIGGVLTGQDLIHAAKVRAQIQQFNDFSTASATFQTKYDSLPGDWTNPNNDTSFLDNTSNSRNSGTGTGDGNGLIQSAGSDTTGGGGETLMFYSDLADSGYIRFQPIGTTAANLTAAFTTVTDFLPVSKISAGSYVAIYYYNGYHWLNLSNYSGAASSTTTYTSENGYAITPQDAYDIDSKMDDGLPNTGTVLASSYTTSTAITYNATASSTGNYCVVGTSATATTDTYNTMSTTNACSLQVKL